MMRKIIRALANALRSFVKMLDGTWRYVFGSGGGDIVLDDDYDAPAPIDKTVESAGKTPALDEDGLRTDRRRDAALIYTYAGRCQLEGARPPMPPCLPRVVRDWLPGLDKRDLQVLTDAGMDAIFTHISEKGPFIQGIHRVQRLQPVALETAPGHAIDDDDVPRDIADLRPTLGF